MALAARDGSSAPSLGVTAEPTANSGLEPALWVLVRPDWRRKSILDIAYRTPRRTAADVEATISDLEVQLQRASIDHAMNKVV